MTSTSKAKPRDRPPLSARSSAEKKDNSKLHAGVIMHANSTEKKDSSKASSPIRVVVRVRPKLAAEEGELDGVQTWPDEASLSLTNGTDLKTFTVDDVIDSRPQSGSSGSQAAVFKRVGVTLVQASVNGFNICIFAYGHTGSGKTFTILGGNGGKQVHGNDVGLLPRCMSEIFTMHAQDPRKKNTRYTCEYLEVYNEQIRDLLAPVNNSQNCKVHVHPKHGVRIDGLSQNVVHNNEEALWLLKFGNQVRTVAGTTMNARSSRSHAIFTLKFEHNGENITGQRSVVTFVDLAGREDQEASTNVDQQFREMCYINKSLFHLAHLVSKLSEGRMQTGSLADFRNSKLTLLLSQALAGNSRTLLLATVAPMQSYFDDSCSTLKFAQAAKRITTKPIVNAKSGIGIAKELEKELMALRQELVQAKSGKTEKEQELLDAQALITYYKQSWEDAVVKSEQLAVRRRTMSATMGLSTAECLTHPKSVSGRLLPFLTKLCDDEISQGCCNYILKNEGIAYRIGSDVKCEIRLRGVGIKPMMCEVVYTAPARVTVRLLPDVTLSPTQGGTKEVPRVIVNGRDLEPQKPINLSNGGSIILGYAHAFRLIMPDDNFSNPASVDTVQLAQTLAPSLDMQTALREIQDEKEGRTFQAFVTYVDEFSKGASEDQVQTLLKVVRLVCPLIDEANLISDELSVYEYEVSFELVALSSSIGGSSKNVPTLVVCMVQRQSGEKSGSAIQVPTRGQRSGSESSQASQRRDSGDALLYTRRSSLKRAQTAELDGTAKHPMCIGVGLGEQMWRNGYALLYTWSLEKFLMRLKEMRELYQEGTDTKDGFDVVRKRLQAKPYLSPWNEIRIGDINLMVEDAVDSRLVSRSRDDSSSSNLPFSMRAVSDATSPMGGSPVGGVSYQVPSAYRFGSDATPPMGGSPAVGVSYHVPSASRFGPNAISAEPKSKLMLSFEGLDGTKIDQEAFTHELFDQLQRRGISDGPACHVTFTPNQQIRGSVFVEVCGGVHTIGEILKQVQAKTIAVMGRVPCNYIESSSPEVEAEESLASAAINAAELANGVHSSMSSTAPVITSEHQINGTTTSDLPIHQQIHLSDEATGADNLDRFLQICNHSPEIMRALCRDIESLRTGLHDQHEQPTQSLMDQASIASILDRFESLLNNLASLPQLMGSSMNATPEFSPRACLASTSVYQLHTPAFTQNASPSRPSRCATTRSVSRIARTLPMSSLATSVPHKSQDWLFAKPTRGATRVQVPFQSPRVVPVTTAPTSAQTRFISPPRVPWISMPTRKVVQTVPLLTPPVAPQASPPLHDHQEQRFTSAPVPVVSTAELLTPRQTTAHVIRPPSPSLAEYAASVVAAAATTAPTTGGGAEAEQPKRRLEWV